MNNPDIVPFWNRLDQISLYPAKGGALATVFVLSLCQIFTLLPMGWIIRLLLWVAIYKYAFECLRASANGRLEPPDVSYTVDDSLGWAQIWLQVAFVVFNVLGFLLLGPVLGTVIAIVLAVALPAAVMALAMDENLGHALNPATWIAVMSRFGAPYFAVAALYFVFNISQAQAQALVLPFLPPVVSNVVLAFITFYVIVATFHLMGYLIYQYHDEVGYVPEPVQAPLRRPAQADPDQATLDEAAELVRDGEVDAARTHIAEQLRSRGGTEALHTQYRKLLALGGHLDEQLRHGREWISILLGQDKDRRAVDVARECLELDPAFQPSSPDEVSRIAHKAVESGNSQVALRLLSGFHKRHPKHADIPKNYLLAAKLLTERMGKDQEARGLLDQLIDHYPNHPLAGEIAAYRKFLDTLAPKPKLPAPGS